MLDTTMRRDVIEKRHIQDASDDTRALLKLSHLRPRDNGAERAQSHTNNRCWSWLIMHYRGGVFVPIAIFAFLRCCELFRLPAFVSRLASVCFWISRIRRAALRLTKFGPGFFHLLVPGRIYTTVAFFVSWAGFSFTLLCFLLFNNPMRNGSTSIGRVTLTCDRPFVYLATRPRLFLYRERQRERQLVLFLLPIYQLNSRILNHIFQRVPFQQPPDFPCRLQDVFLLVFMMEPIVSIVSTNKLLERL